MIRAYICPIRLPNPSSSSYQILVLHLPIPCAPVTKSYYSSQGLKSIGSTGALLPWRAHFTRKVVSLQMKTIHIWCKKSYIEDFYRHIIRNNAIYLHVLPGSETTFQALLHVPNVLEETQGFGSWSTRIWRLLKFIVNKLKINFQSSYSTYQIPVLRLPNPTTPVTQSHMF